MNNEPILCNSCQHNMKNSSCGACADNAINTMKNLDSAVQNKSESVDIDYLIYSCKVGVNDPSVIKELNPFHCRYYLSNAFKIR